MNISSTTTTTTTTYFIRICTEKEHNELNRICKFYVDFDKYVTPSWNELSDYVYREIRNGYVINAFKPNVFLMTHLLSDSITIREYKELIKRV
jgi:hypothetical protein